MTVCFKLVPRDIVVDLTDDNGCCKAHTAREKASKKFLKDNINHSALVGLINAKIKDARLIKLIYKFLKAGYMENWQYQNTYSGTPQGGIISLLLANICLHELDKFVMGLKVKFDKPRVRWHTPEYDKARYQVESIREQLKNAAETEKQKLVTKLKNAREVFAPFSVRNTTSQSTQSTGIYLTLTRKTLLILRSFYPPKYYITTASLFIHEQQSLS